MVETEAEWGIEKRNGDIVITVADDEENIEVYTLDPLMAATVASMIFDKIEQEEDDE